MDRSSVIFKENKSWLREGKVNTLDSFDLGLVTLLDTHYFGQNLYLDSSDCIEGQELGLAVCPTEKDTYLVYSQFRESTAKGTLQRWPNWNQGLRCLTHNTVFSKPNYIAIAIVCSIPLKPQPTKVVKKGTKKKWAVSSLRKETK